MRTGARRERQGARLGLFAAAAGGLPFAAAAAGPLLAPAGPAAYAVDWRRCYESTECAATAEAPLEVPAGAAVAFAWDALAGDGIGHNVVRVAGRAAFDACESADGLALGGPPAVWTAPAAAEVVYFVCAVGDHCRRGMRLALAAVPPSPPAEGPAAFECFRWRRKREQRRGFLAATLDLDLDLAEAAAAAEPAGQPQRRRRNRNPSAAECRSAAAAAGHQRAGLVRLAAKRARCVAGEVPEGYKFGGKFGPLPADGCGAEGTLGAKKVVTVYHSASG